MMRIRQVSILSVAILGACAGPGLMANTAADAGPAPTNAKLLVEAVLKSTLKDPRSLQDLEVGAPIADVCAMGVYGGFHGWAVPVSYNAKNSYGGYVGLRHYFFWFHGDKYRGQSVSRDLCTEAVTWEKQY